MINKNNQENLNNSNNNSIEKNLFKQKEISLIMKIMGQ